MTLLETAVFVISTVAELVALIDHHSPRCVVVDSVQVCSLLPEDALAIARGGKQIVIAVCQDTKDGKAAGSAQWLFLADFEQTSSPQLPTWQIRGSTAGLEVLVYDVGANQLQVLGALSRGEENAPTLLNTDAEPDFAFTADLNTVYLTQPIALHRAAKERAR